MSRGVPYPEAARLARDLAKLGRLVDRPFSEFLDDDALWRLAESGKKDRVREAFASKLGPTDDRIRYVQAHKKGYPSGTMKLFGALELAKSRYGRRMTDILGGGVVAVAVRKADSPSDWRITGVYEFLPAGSELERCECSLEELAFRFRRRDPSAPFSAISRPPFQIRTGSSSGGYAVYLLAGKYFGQGREDYA
jgi:hypothetical protein